MDKHPAIENLRTNQTQLDADGCMVGVSRQAIEETLTEIAGLRAELAARDELIAALSVAIDKCDATARQDAEDKDGEILTLDPWQAFAYFVSKCGEGFGTELMKKGKTETQARNAIIGCFLDFAAGEACRVARSEGREPDHEKWTKAVNGAFERAVKRTVPWSRP